MGRQLCVHDTKGQERSYWCQVVCARLPVVLLIKHWSSAVLENPAAASALLLPTTTDTYQLDMCLKRSTGTGGQTEVCHQRPPVRNHHCWEEQPWDQEENLKSSCINPRRCWRQHASNQHDASWLWYWCMPAATHAGVCSSRVRALKATHP
jgi:hypothetical protein